MHLARVDVMYDEEFIPLDIADCGEVAGLEALCFPTAWKEEQYRVLVEKGRCKLFGARRQGRLLAYIALGTAPGLPDMEIYNIAVDPSERRKGLGKKLLELSLEAARLTSIERILLEVRESNTAARALYEGAGFVSHGRRKSYYSAPPEDAVLYIYHCAC